MTRALTKILLTIQCTKFFAAAKSLLQETKFRLNARFRKCGCFGYIPGPLRSCLPVLAIGPKEDLTDQLSDTMPPLAPSGFILNREN